MLNFVFAACGKHSVSIKAVKIPRGFVIIMDFVDVSLIKKKKTRNIEVS